MAPDPFERAEARLQSEERLASCIWTKEVSQVTSSV